MNRDQGPWRHALVIATMVALGLAFAQCGPAEARAQETGAALTAPEPEPRREYVRVTFYINRGFMTSGLQTHLGAAACSKGYPLGTQLEMPDRWVVTCLDRGRLGEDTGWVDIWASSLIWGYRFVEGDYGRFAWVTVLRWGWGSTWD